MCSEISLHFWTVPRGVLTDCNSYFSETCVGNHMLLMLEAFLAHICYSLTLLKQKVDHMNGIMKTELVNVFTLASLPNKQVLTTEL